MESWVEHKVEPMLSDPCTNWQPNDLLPDAGSEGFFDRVHALRQDCKDLPAHVWLVLVGDMVTEEALPSYLSMLNRMDGTSDESGGSNTAWARWNRGWTSEENRHGDLLNKLLYLSGRVDMRAVEASIQRLIGTGFNPQLGTDPYRCFIYTSFQERATKISHRNTGRLAAHEGATSMARACAKISGDEARHEEAYQRIIGEIFARDPDGTMCAFADMMRAGIVMPAHLMTDSEDTTVLPGRAGQAPETPFFRSFSRVAEDLGVYTAHDYAEIFEFLVRRWKIADVSGLNGDAAAAQEFLMNHTSRVRRMADVHAQRRERSRKQNGGSDGHTIALESSWILP